MLEDIILGVKGIVLVIFTDRMIFIRNAIPGISILIDGVAIMQTARVFTGKYPYAMTISGIFLIIDGTHTLLMHWLQPR